MICNKLYISVLSCSPFKSLISTTANDLYLHRTKTINADNIYKTQINKLLVPPITLEEFEEINDLKTYEFNIDEGSYDLLISGVGCIHLVGKNISFNVTLYKEIDVQLVPTFI